MKLVPIIGIYVMIARITTCLAFHRSINVAWKIRHTTNEIPIAVATSTSTAPSIIVKARAARCQLCMSRDDDSDDDDEEDDDDDDDYIEDKDLGDWRSFRKTLVDSGISCADATAEEGYLDTTTDAAAKKKKEEEPSGSIEKAGAGDAVVDASKGSSIERPTSVSKANERLLEKQSEALAKEYRGGVWAHESGFAEIGGLVVRMPLEAEIYKNGDKTIIGRELAARLRNEPEIGSKTNVDEQPAVIAAQTLRWYRKAQQLIREEMTAIASRANERGEVDPTGLPPKTEDLLRLYVGNQQDWQSVCLVAGMDDESNGGGAETYTLNRPLAFSLTETLGKTLLFGATSNLIRDGRIPISETNKFNKFLRAFEKQCAVYVGGKDDQDKPAVVVHGLPDLEGATEIAAGTGIYTGGLEAAIEGVLEGRFEPLDFRFFVGCNQYRKGELGAAILSNKYQPIACARSLALKQCIQLPKPLWHEVMEMCGGELREVSRLELKKRSDLSQE